MNLAEFGQTMHMQEFSRSLPTTPSGLQVNEADQNDKIEKIKIVVAEVENLDSKSGESDVHLLEDTQSQASQEVLSNVGEILARRESLDELIEDLEVDSEIVKKEQFVRKQQINTHQLRTNQME